MDFGLDHEKAITFDCSKCPANLQALRNCLGTGTPAKIELNSSFYTRCPRAIVLEDSSARYMTNLYGECRDTGCLPYPGGPTAQTQFCSELFNYLDSLVSKYRAALYKKQKSDN